MTSGLLIKPSCLRPYGASEGTGQLAKGPPSAGGLASHSTGHGTGSGRESSSGTVAGPRGHCLGGLTEETFSQ